MLIITQFSRASSSFHWNANKNEEQAAEKKKRIKNSGKYNNIRGKRRGRKREGMRKYKIRPFKNLLYNENNY